VHYAVRRPAPDSLSLSSHFVSEDKALKSYAWHLYLARAKVTVHTLQTKAPTGRNWHFAHVDRMTECDKGIRTSLGSASFSTRCTNISFSRTVPHGANISRGNCAQIWLMNGLNAHRYCIANCGESGRQNFFRELLICYQAIENNTTFLWSKMINLSSINVAPPTGTDL
jgi:hypothetical protein